MLSLFGGSGYRYNFSLFTFDKVHGVEGALPQQPAVFVFARRGYDRRRNRFTFDPICCSATTNLAGVAVSELAKSVPALVDANCVGWRLFPARMTAALWWTILRAAFLHSLLVVRAAFGLYCLFYVFLLLI